VFANVEVFPVENTDHAPLYLERIQTSTIAHPDPEMDGLVGESPAFSRMLAAIHRVAHQNATVLLLGETGTGKDLVSQAIHKLSPRGGKPFVAVDCSGLPENLIESELFGHEKGAFTGAHSRKMGLVEAARGGTLFLDEIGELPLNLQAKLLRLLETNVYRPVGGVDAKKADIRLISATHRDLSSMVREGTFRQDLFYRINVFPVHLPALRDRPGDIPLLVETILGRLSKPSPPVSKDAMDLLLSHD
jgi:transcriptional regulator with PAS, ATPase and Fis domain